ncbi:hypothetical protein [Schumannella soli]|uniref:Uncharacterized protein n=1 Tax=Schumannella soli TaxID=2590779 RepID=A0A506XT68_9MICO|nr:hypothetical protein [Schumannella soli]TPW75901.1 hypothetical protein FJ657_08620 [Schumannella soli]
MPDWDSSQPWPGIAAALNNYRVRTYRPTGFAELAGYTSVEPGALAILRDSGAEFVYYGGWKQTGPAFLASVAARNTYFAAAGGVYLVAGATARIGAVLYEYSGTVWVQRGAASGQPFAMQAGNLSAALNTTGVLNVAFLPGRFAAAPIVTVTLGNFVANGQVVVDTITTSGCRILTFNVSTGSSIAGLAVRWQAVQMLPGSGEG